MDLIQELFYDRVMEYPVVYNDKELYHKSDKVFGNLCDFVSLLGDKEKG